MTSFSEQLAKAVRVREEAWRAEHGEALRETRARLEDMFHACNHGAAQAEMLRITAHGPLYVDAATGVRYCAYRLFVVVLSPSHARAVVGELKEMVAREYGVSVYPELAWDYGDSSKKTLTVYFELRWRVYVPHE